MAEQCAQAGKSPRGCAGGTVEYVVTRAPLGVKVWLCPRHARTLEELLDLGEVVVSPRARWVVREQVPDNKR